MIHPKIDGISQAHWDDADEHRFIRYRKDAETGYIIANYTKLAMVNPKSAWSNPAVRVSRGLIFTEDGTVVARGFDKFFNYGEDPADTFQEDNLVSVHDKVDGSLGISYIKPDGTMAIATRGSLTSEQAIHATELLNTKYRLFVESFLQRGHAFSFLFEIVYPENRIVLDYGGLDDLVLLGGRFVDSDNIHDPEVVASVFGWTGLQSEVVTGQCMLFKDAIKLNDRNNAEGVVIASIDGKRRVKVKQQDYVERHRIVSNLTEVSIWEAMVSGQTLQGFLQGIPDELHDWVRSVWVGIVIQMENISSRVAEALPKQDVNWSRKELALWVLSEYADIKTFVFMAVDGKPYREAILKSLKPKG